MADYKVADDGKLHTRYSELLRCTPGQIDRVVWDRTNPQARVETADMSFGSVRHEMLEEEARETGRLPECFGIDEPADFIEHEFATEMLKDVIVHSRPDCVTVSAETVWDYKTVVDGKNGWRENLRGYGWREHGPTVETGKHHQLQFYAFQLGLHGIRIKHGAFLCEIWNAERDTIIGYEVVKFDITYRQIAGVASWAKNRVAMLSSVLDEVAA